MLFTQLQLSILAENKRWEHRRIGTGAGVREGGEGRVGGGGSWKGWEEREKGRGCMIIQQQCLIYFVVQKGCEEEVKKKGAGVGKFPLLKYLHSLSATTLLYNEKTVEHFQPLTCKIIHSHKLKWRAPSSAPTFTLLLMRSPRKPVTFLKWPPVCLPSSKIWCHYQRESLLLV